MGMLGRALVSPGLVLADFVLSDGASMTIFWFQRSSTKHVVIKYTRKFTLLLCCLFLIVVGSHIDSILRSCNTVSLL